MANYRVATASDYQTLLKEYNKNAEGVSNWEELFLKPLQETTETAAQHVTQQANYDISSAYANYKKSQLSLMQNQQLGSGFKEEIGSELKSEYDTAYKGIKTQEASDLSSIGQSYLQTLAKEDERLYEQGEKFAKLESAVYDFVGVGNKDLEKEGYYARSAEDPTKYNITEKGIELFDRAFHYGKDVLDKDKKTIIGRKSFEDYLNTLDEDLYDFYKQNKPTINQLVGGLSESDWSYDPEERKYKLEIENIVKKDSSFYEKELKDSYDNYENKLKDVKELQTQKTEINKILNSSEYKNNKTKFDEIKRENFKTYKEYYEALKKLQNQLIQNRRINAMLL